MVMNKEFSLIAFSAIVVLLLIIFYDGRKESARSLVEYESKVIVSTHGKNYDPPEDPWGTSLEWHFEPDQKANKGTAVSAGPDQKIGTPDDIQHTSVDFNKTGIVAEWAGSKVNEGVKGFIRGLKNPSKHEETK